MQHSEVATSKFQELAAINVNEHVEKKNGLSYLSWAWAWAELCKQDPDASFEYGDPKPFGDTLMVFCTVTAFGKPRTCHLPVMDHRNKAIASPDAFQVNTAMQRCLVKAIALHGLGLYIYAGEDLPDGAEPEAKPGAVKSVQHKPTDGAKDGLNAEEQATVSACASRVMDFLTADQIADAVVEYQNTGMGADETVYFWTFFDSKQRSAMKKEHEKQKLDRAMKEGRGL